MIYYPFLCLLVLGTAMIGYESLDYFLPSEVHPFFLERPAMTAQQWWRVMISVHAVSGVLCLVCCWAQYSPLVMKKAPAVHKVSGRVYGYNNLLVVVPTGILLAFFAKGGLLGILGILAIGVGTGISTFLGVRAAMKKKIAVHKRWITFSFALVSTAISFRLCQFALAQAVPSFEHIYVTTLWGTLGLNLLLAQLYLSKTKPTKL